MMGLCDDVEVYATMADPFTVEFFNDKYSHQYFVILCFYLSFKVLFYYLTLSCFYIRSVFTVF